ncbi:unnamed protein product [Cuscuta epithymum]|uniref:Uncharacterized protein n=1 Tax=Cuscuta epithymum TaxID=186058 RepID=A0AAV0CH12_9ASTE|nr:unnamed protein product [Cuscuta epithymum]
MTINGAGVAIEVVFLFVFFFCSDKRKRLELGVAILVEVIFFAALVALVITLAHTWETRSAVVGGIAALASIVMYASPLASMKLVITTKSVEYMPLSLSVCSLVNSLCWSLYALMRMEIFILVTIYSISKTKFCTFAYVYTLHRTIKKRKTILICAILGT